MAEYMRTPARRGLAALLCALAAVVTVSQLGISTAKETKKTESKAESKKNAKEKHVIGATAQLREPETGYDFKCRVDTGAKTTSLHVEEWKIIDEVKDEDIKKEMAANIGKMLRFRVKNKQGEEKWIERKIANYAIYKTSEKMERRYKVKMKLKWKDFEKEVLVNLNDRSHLEFPLLLGRNYLRGDFVVDVDMDVSQRD
ncbi:MAG: RimK/LysX family protein [Lacipirellulaceae bacterium]